MLLLLAIYAAPFVEPSPDTFEERHQHRREALSLESKPSGRDVWHAEKVLMDDYLSSKPKNRRRRQDAWEAAKVVMAD